MALVTIYSFQLNSFTRVTVQRDDTNPTVFDSFNTTTPSTTPGHPPPDIMVSSACYGTTRYKYYWRDGNPYVRYETEVNSTICGFIPPACDIELKSLVITDETEEDANDGTINMFAVSSFNPITYYLQSPALGYNENNLIGYFTGLSPATDYSMSAIDAHGCVVLRVPLTVLPFDNTKTHYKYRLKFKSVINNIDWELRLFDLRNNYDETQYPKDLEGMDSPVVIKQANQEEDKTATIVSKTLEINLLFDGVSFTTDEFTLADPYKWFVEYYMNGELEFRGWLIPDEIQDLYSDPSYAFQLIATDGVPNLKGNSWGNGSGGNGYTDSQVQQYGLKQWANLVKQCLDQLGYDYGDVIIFSSLIYDNAYDPYLWTKLGCWGDLLYDGNGNAIDTYQALETLLSGMKLRLIQHKGKFIFYNENDLFYLDKPLSNYQYQRSFYLTDLVDTFDTGVLGYSSIEKPLPQFIGFNAPIIPINPAQSLNYDKPYNIKSTIDFNILALLYPNPSFEIGAVEGELPSEFIKVGSDGGFQAFLHNEGENAYSGNWVLRLQWVNNGLALNNRVEFDAGGIFIDQPNKKINVSIQWREGNHPPLEDDDNITISYRLIFTDQNGGQQYVFSPTSEDGSPQWINFVSGGFFSNAKVRIDDFVSWNSYNQTTTILPGSGIGYFNIRINAPVNLDPRANGEGIGDFMIIDYDQLELSISDANDQYSKQTGEIHTTKVVTGVPQASVKDINSSLFTYPQNKRIAGNIFIGFDYPTAIVGNNWNFALKSLIEDDKDRLPAVITKAVERTYFRPMRKFEGDFQCPYVQFYGTFKLTWYEASVFEAFSIELDCKNETGHVVLIEISDDDAQFIYKYTPVFERNARRNVSN